MTRLPLFEPARLLELLTADLPAPDLDTARRCRATSPRPWGDCSVPGSRPSSIRGLKLPADATVRQVYAALIDTDAFRVACGRISASYAW